MKPYIANIIGCMELKYSLDFLSYIELNVVAVAA